MISAVSDVPGSDLLGELGAVTVAALPFVLGAVLCIAVGYGCLLLLWPAVSLQEALKRNPFTKRLGEKRIEGIAALFGLTLIFGLAFLAAQPRKNPEIARITAPSVPIYVDSETGKEYRADQVDWNQFEIAPADANGKAQ